MPGHSSAAIAAYTWLGTAGKDIDVPVKFGRHYDNYDITKPEVEQFVKDVLNELFELFPNAVYFEFEVNISAGEYQRIVGDANVSGLLYP